MLLWYPKLNRRVEGGGGGRGGFNLHDIIKSGKYRRSIENLQFLTPNKAHGRKFRENDVKIGEK